MQPGKQALDLPATAIAPQGAPVLRRRPSPVAFMRSDHLNAQSREVLGQRSTVIGAVPNQPVGQSGGEPLRESGVDQGDFMGCSRRRVDGDRKTMTALSCVPLPRLVAPTSRPFFSLR